MKHAFESVWLRRALAAVCVAVGLVIAALVLHPPPPPSGVRLDVAAPGPVPAAPEPLSARRRHGARGAVGSQPELAVVYVAGAVARPGVYALAATARVGDALARAGGANGDADLLRVNLAAHVSDGEEIAVLRRGEAPPGVRRAASPRRAVHRKKRRTADVAAVDATPLDLNRASADDLAQLPGLGSELAERIVEFRDVNGPFASVDELADVSGMTPGRLDRLLDRLTVR